MSYIHEALKKAQKERDISNAKYSGFLPVWRKDLSLSRSRAVLWISLVIIVVLLGFFSYLWFDYRASQTTKTAEHKNEKPAAPLLTQPVTRAKDLYDRARLLYKRGHLQDARRLYEETLKLEPDNVEALNNLGVIYLHEKDFLAARSSFEKAVRLNPDYVDPHYNLACIHSLSGEVRQSIINLKKAVLLDPSVREWARKDADLKNLRATPEFKEIIKSGTK